MTRIPHLWIPRKVGSVTRYHREGKSGYNMRRMMDPAPPGQSARRRWALFCGDSRVWDVQPNELLSAAIDEAEAWIAGR